MPDVLQTLPLVQIWDQVYDPTTGLPVPIGTSVVVTWKILQGSVTNPIVKAIPKSLVVFTTANGYWTASVVPTDKLSPANSTYHVSDGYNSYDINPITAGMPVGGWQTVNITVAPAAAVLNPAGQTVGPLQVNGTLGVTGLATLTGGLQVNGTLGVTGAVTLSALTAGQVVFPGVAGLLSGDANLFWDNVTKRLGVGTNVPAVLLDVNGVTILRGSLTLTLAQLLMTGANPIISMTGAGTAQITGGTTGFQIANNAATLVNLGITDAGDVSIPRGDLLFPAFGSQRIKFTDASGTPNKWLRANAGQFQIWNSAFSTALFTLADSGVATIFGYTTVAGLYSTADPGGGFAGQLGLTNGTGLGNGAATNMQAPLKGTGGGPASAILVTDWIKVYDGATVKWLPAFT